MNRADRSTRPGILAVGRSNEHIPVLLHRSRKNVKALAVNAVVVGQHDAHRNEPIPQSSN